MTIREVSIGLFVDAMFGQLPETVRNRKHVFKTALLFQKKHMQLAKTHPHLIRDGEKLAIESWDDCQSLLNQEVAVSLIIKLTIQAEPWIITKYKLNPKKLDKMYNAFKVDDIIFRSSRAVTAYRKMLDENIARLNYRRDN